MPNSSIFSFPIGIAPASSKRFVAVDSYGETKSASNRHILCNSPITGVPESILEHAVVGTFSMQKLSFTPMGIPSRIPIDLPNLRLKSASLDNRMDRSKSVYTNAFRCFELLICSMHNFVSSAELIRPCVSASLASKRLFRSQTLLFPPAAWQNRLEPFMPLNCNVTRICWRLSVTRRSDAVPLFGHSGDPAAPPHNHW